MNKKIIIGNWKMNPKTVDEAKHIARKIRSGVTGLNKVETVICPSFAHLVVCSSAKQPANFHLGAQSVSMDEEGAHTGEVSADILRDIGVEYVIVGHSEERERGETSSNISRKIGAVLRSGLQPVVCIGEKNRDPEGGAHFDFLKLQIKETFANVPKNQAKKIILAYEPVWAIGASESMAPDQIYEMALFVRKVFSDIFDPGLAVKIPVLYGGSVNFRNAADIIITGKVDGLLVGRESVNVTGFLELLKAVDSVS